MPHQRRARDPEEPPTVLSDTTLDVPTIKRDEVIPAYRPSRSMVALSWLIPVFTALLIVSPALRNEMPNGDDTPFHLVRNERSVDELFPSGHLDGWNPKMLAGDQQFLAYGPGLAISSAAVEIVSLGFLGGPGALAVVTAFGYVGTALAAWILARALHFRLPGASAAGLLSILVSVSFGIGPTGTYGRGLIPHQLSAPLSLVLLALLVKLVEQDDRRWITLSALASTVLLITHPISLLITAIVFVLWLLASLPYRRPDRFVFKRLLGAGGLALGLSSFWLLPFLESNEDVAGITTWGVAPLLLRARATIDGTDWAHPMVAALAATGAVVVLTWVADRSPRIARLGRWPLGLVLAPAGLIVLLQAVYHHSDSDLAFWIPNRGLGLAMLLWVFPAALVFDELFGNRRTPIGLGALLILAALVVQIDDSIPGRADIAPAGPTHPELELTADMLRSEVPDHGRFVWSVDAGWDYTPLGHIHPEFWLVWRSGVSSLNGFSTTITPIDPFLSDRVAEGNIDYVQPLLDRAGVTHMVASTIVAEIYLVSGGWTALDNVGRLWILERNVDPELATAPDVQNRLSVVKWEPEAVQWSVNSPGPAVLAIPAVPKWEVAIDGTTVPVTSTDGYLTIDIPEGASAVSASFVRTALDRYAFLVSLLTLSLWFGWPAYRRRRIHPMMRSDESLSETPT